MRVKERSDAEAPALEIRPYAEACPRDSPESGSRRAQHFYPQCRERHCFQQKEVLSLRREKPFALGVPVQGGGAPSLRTQGSVSNHKIKFYNKIELPA